MSALVLRILSVSFCVNLKFCALGGMTIYQLLGTLAGVGAMGGLVNCAIAGEFSLPHTDPVAKVWRPGWLGNVLCGAIAALVVWGLYGPLSTYELTGGQTFSAQLTISQLFTSLVVGLSGGRILTVEAQKQMLQREKDAEKDAKNDLAAAVQEVRSQ